MINGSAVERFAQLKQKRDTMEKQHSMLQGRLDSSREAYQEIMRELAKHGIGSLDELQSKIAESEKTINERLTTAEQALVQMETELNAL